jgi:predicted nucleotidyltransferase
MVPLNDVHDFGKHDIACFKALLDKPTHVQGLIRATGLNPGQVHRSTERLLDNELIKARKQGNQKQLSIKRNAWTRYLRAGIATEHLQRLPAKRRRAIQYYHDALQEQPVITVVHGSTATHDHDQDSDLDLLVINNHNLQVNQAEQKAHSQAGIHVNTLQIPLNDLKDELRLQKDPVIQSAIKQGWPARNKQYYYELLDDAN